MPDALTQPAKLIVKIHGKNSQDIVLRHDSLTIGRKTDNVLCIDDPAVSGHHARIVKIHAVFFLEDLQSTNGTAVNGRTVTRYQLHDADVITIGQHRIVFQESSALSAAPKDLPDDINHTVVLKKTGLSSDAPAIIAKILITTGKTDRSEYTLTKPITMIGAQEDATIRLTGWFAPKSVAAITRRGQGYTVSPLQNAKSLRVNGAEVVGQQILKDGDQIEVAGVTMMLYMLAKTA